MTAAHLLCEESRRRWVNMLRDEDGLIDDISCLLLEFKEVRSPSIPLGSDDESMVEFLRAEERLTEKCE